MNPAGKKFVSLFLVFALLEMSCILYSPEKGIRAVVYQEKKQGANLLIEKKDGQFIKGELITVKPNSLLLLNTEGKDVFVDVEEIKIITIIKKSRVGKSILYGTLIGVSLGVSVALVAGRDYEPETKPLIVVGGGILGVFIGFAAGAFTGAHLSEDIPFQIETMADSEIQETLEKLRRKARIRDYR